MMLTPPKKSTVVASLASLCVGMFATVFFDIGVGYGMNLLAFLTLFLGVGCKRF